MTQYHPKKTHPFFNSANNDYGETPLPYAPILRFECGLTAVPQQYLSATRNLKELECIAEKISLPDGYILFTGVENDLLYLTVGILGHENYGSANDKKNPKLVYGRRWLIDSNMPTSEVIQTAMLATQKAREHELREKITIEYNGHTSTPFSCHIDLPLLSVVHQHSASQHRTLTLAERLKRIRIDGNQLELKQITPLSNGSSAYELFISKSHYGLFTELCGTTLTILVSPNNTTELEHLIVESLIQTSHRYVEECFRFDGFNRFSHQHPIEDLCQFSYRTRHVMPSHPEFMMAFKQMNRTIDAAKAPQYAQGPLGINQQSLVFNKGNNVNGYLPIAPFKVTLKSIN